MANEEVTINIAMPREENDGTSAMVVIDMPLVSVRLPMAKDRIRDLHGVIGRALEELDTREARTRKDKH